MTESQQTKPLFDKALVEIQKVLDAGTLTDAKFMQTVMQVFTGHIKILNSERARDALQYTIAKSVTENIEAMKEAIREHLPQYMPQNREKK